MAEAFPTQADLAAQIGDFLHAQNRAISLFLYVSHDRFTEPDIQWYNALGGRFEHRPTQELLAKILHESLQQGPETARPNNLTLLSLELTGITERLRREHDQLEKVASQTVPDDDSEEPALYRRKRRVKESLMAGAVVVGSLDVLLGPGAPSWLRSLLVIGKQGIDTLTI